MEVGHQHHSLNKWNPQLFAVRSLIGFDKINREEKTGAREKVKYANKLPLANK